MSTDKPFLPDKPRIPEAVYVWWSDLDQEWRIRKWDMQQFVEGSKYVRADLAGTPPSADSEIKTVLRELVELKSMKDRNYADGFGLWINSDEQADYEVRQPKAWKRAREVLAGTAPSSEPDIERLREIEHLAWHLMDDSEEDVATGEIRIRPMREDYDRLAALLPEDHPAERTASHVPDIDRNRWPHGRATVEASRPLETHDGNTPPGGRTPGFLLYCHVYEARWAGLKTGEYCPLWRDVPTEIRARWEALAGNIATEVARAASFASAREEIKK